MVGNYLEAVNYADFALGKLIEGLKSNGLWDETLLIVYGDHFGLRPDSTLEKKLLRQILGREYNDLDVFKIPLIIKIPGYNDEILRENVGGQIDLMPTIANLVGLSLDDSIYFGQDLLNTEENLLGMRFYLPSGSFINSEVLFIPGKGFDDGTAINIKTGEAEKEIKGYKGDFKQAKTLLNLSDSYINKMPERNDLKNDMINIPHMKIVQVNPTEITAGEIFNNWEGEASIGLVGENFDVDSIIYANNVPLKTTYGGANFITAIVPAELYNEPGEMVIKVRFFDEHGNLINTSNNFIININEKARD